MVLTNQRTPRGHPARDIPRNAISGRTTLRGSQRCGKINLHFDAHRRAALIDFHRLLRNIFNILLSLMHQRDLRYFRNNALLYKILITSSRQSSRISGMALISRASRAVARHFNRKISLLLHLAHAMEFEQVKELLKNINNNLHPEFPLD